MRRTGTLQRAIRATTRKYLTVTAPYVTSRTAQLMTFTDDFMTIEFDDFSIQIQIRIGFWTSKSHPNPDLDRLQIWT